ncbi:MAG: magnesium/cobalt transporter CorA [Rhodanobacteraceae bacterium]
MISIKAWAGGGQPAQEIDPAAFVLTDIGSWQTVWIDLSGEDADGHRQFMKRRLHLPRLAIEDAMHERHPPKLEALDDGWFFLLLRGFDAGSTSVKFGTIQLPMFWRDNLLVTRHAKASASIREVEQALSDGSQKPPEGTGALLYAIVRRLLDRYLPILLKLEGRLEEIEDVLLQRPDDRLLSELMEYSSQLKRLRRISAYHEKCFTSLGTHDPAQHGLRRAQLTDLLEHAERLNSLATLHSEITSNLIDGYLSVSAHRLNNVMRVLTVVTVLFVPLTFIAGVYGMNFEFMPELHWRYSYFVVVGVMLALAISLLLIFRRKNWI